MFSRLDGLFRTHFRHAEQLDTRLGIRRQDSDGERKKNERNTEEESTGADDDLPVVSLDALIVFLQQLLPQESAIENAASAEQRSDQKKSHAPAASPQNRAAIRAYEKNTGAATRDYAPPPPVAPVTTAPALADEEIKTIRELLPRLQTLRGAGKQSLALGKSSSFLQSLVDAASAAMTD